MPRYTNAKSVDVLDEAERFERVLAWQDFVHENEKVVYGDYTGWQPGDNLITHTYDIQHCRPDCVECEEALGPYPELISDNHRRPMIQELEAGYSAESEAYYRGFFRCNDCMVSWVGDEPCFSCGRMRLEKGLSLGITPKRTVTSFDPARPDSRPWPPDRSQLMRRSLTPLVDLETMWLEGRYDDYEAALEKDVQQIVPVTLPVLYDSNQIHVTMEFDSNGFVRSVGSVSDAMAGIGQATHNVARSFEGMSDQFQIIGTMANTGVDMVSWLREEMRSMLEAETRQVMERMFWGNGSDEEVEYGRPWRGLTTVEEESPRGIRGITPQRYYVDEWAGSSLGWIPRQSRPELPHVPEGQQRITVEDDNGSRVSIVIPVDIPTQVTYEVPQARPGLEPLDTYRALSLRQQLLFNRPATEQRRRRDG